MTSSNQQLIGKKLKKDMYNQAGVLVLSAMTVLNSEHMKELKAHSITLNDDDVEPENEKSEFHQRIDDSVLKMEEIFQDIRFMKQIPLMDIRQQIIPVIHQAVEEKDLFRLFSYLQPEDDYLYRHNIAVGIIATLIGKWLQLKENELSQLTIAATLHDVGKVKIPLEILHKPEQYTPEEFKMMKKHPIFGYEMIKETVGTNHRQALVALQHHERQDGSGYPLGMKGDQIDFFSRIVAVADVFHAMSSKRNYRNASPFYETLKQMHQNAFGALDPRIVHLFIDKMMQSTIGQEVMLTDGRTGNVVMLHRHDLFRPLVSINGDFFDLSKESSLHIDQILT